MSIANVKKSKGRPKVDSEPLTLRLDRSLITELDDWRRQQPDLPSRAEAIRRLVRQTLEGTA